MITFKQFLQEAAVKNKPVFKQLQVKKAIELLNSKCKNALWMLEKDRPIYRSMVAPLGHFQTIDTAATERKSQNTSNHYTVILDNNPRMKDYPRRSRSFVGTTSINTAVNYAGHPYRMIPFDDAKIGVVNNYDIWNAKVKLLGNIFDLDDANNIFKDLGIKDNYNSFIEFSNKLKSGDSKTVKLFDNTIENSRFKNRPDREYALTNINDIKKDFLGYINAQYSPEKLKFSNYTTATMPRKINDTEVWVEGNVVIINKLMWDELLEAWKSRNK